MDEKYLEKLKSKLGNLTLEEEILRDLYLKGLATGDIQGPPTNYSSIDKTWLADYSDELIKETAPQINIYQNLYENNKDHLDDVAFRYLGTNITYRTLFDNIENTARSLVRTGVKKGDTVTICSITTPEVIYTLFALIKIGAKANMIDLRYTKQAIEKYVNEVNSKLFITLDLAYPKFKDIFENTHLEKMITISPANSAPRVINAISKIKNKLQKQNINIPFGDKVFDWNTIYNENLQKNYEENKFTPNETVVIVHTGGTTGPSKAAQLTNENMNNVTLQTKAVVKRRGFRFLDIMPPFIAYGIGIGLITPLTLGWDTIIIPNFEPKKLPDLLLKYKPNGLACVPVYLEEVMKSEKFKKNKNKFLEIILLGGDRVTAAFEERLNKFFKERGENVLVSKGYSATELSAMTTISTEKSNAPDSVGVPLFKTTVGIFEPGSTKELPVGSIDEICVKSPTIMKGYYNKPEETAQVKVQHSDGIWIHTGDIGYMTKDGLVYIKDRIKRMFPRSGFKVFPSEIEKVFMSNPAIDTCAVVGIPDETDITAPMAHVVLKKEYIGREDEIKEELYNMLENSTLPSYYKPVGIKIRESLPLTNIGKIDFMTLVKEGNSEEKTIKPK